MSGLSDPFCVLEVFGQRQRTRFVKDTSSAFFDETFYFNFKDLKREQIAEGTLKISVYDHNYIRSNDLIGIYQVSPSYFDSPSAIYSNCSFRRSIYKLFTINQIMNSIVMWQLFVILNRKMLLDRKVC